MQFEGMAELIPPLIDADAAKLPPMGGLTDGRLKLHSDLHLIDGRDRSQPRLSDQVARGRPVGLTILSRGLTLNLSDF